MYFKVIIGLILLASSVFAVIYGDDGQGSWEIILTKSVERDTYFIELEGEPLGGSLDYSSRDRNDLLSTHRSVKKDLYEMRGFDNLNVIDMGPKNGHLMYVANGFVEDLSQDEIKELLRNPGVSEIYADQEYQPTALIEYNEIINSEQVWDLGYTGEGVVVAVIDSGINYSHPDFGGCSRQQFLNGNCDKVIGGWDFENGDSDPYDDRGHGTSVASVVAANGLLKGVAPDAKLLVYKASNSDGLYAFSIVLQASEQAVLDGADVLTYSLGGGLATPNLPFNLALNEIVKSGKVITIGAGNQGSRGFDSISSLGGTFEAITVGAYSGLNDEPIIPFFSSKGLVSHNNFGDFPQPFRKHFLKPDVIAPGRNLCAAFHKNFDDFACPEGQYIGFSGTSAATPVAAGVAALLLEKNPNWTPEQIKSAMRNTATDLNEDYRVQGLGLVNALAAINLNQAPPIGIFREITEREDGYEFNATIGGDNYDSYTISIGNGLRPSSYTEYISGNTEFDEEIVVTIPYGALPDGEFNVRLEVTANNNFKVHDYFPHTCDQAECGQGVTFQCNGQPNNANLCSGDDQGLTQNTNSILVNTCSQQNKCEFTCQNGFELVNGQCQEITFACTGSTPSNSIICPNDDQNLFQNTAKTLQDSCTSQKCEYTCNTGYIKVGNSCQPIQYECTGVIPDNAQLCANDNQGLTENLPLLLTNSCTTQKCEYVCQTGFTIKNGVCTQTSVQIEPNKDHLFAILEPITLAQLNLPSNEIAVTSFAYRDVEIFEVKGAFQGAENTYYYLGSSSSFTLGWKLIGKDLNGEFSSDILTDYVIIRSNANEPWTSAQQFTYEVPSQLMYMETADQNKLTFN